MTHIPAPDIPSAKRRRLHLMIPLLLFIISLLLSLAARLLTGFATAYSNSIYRLLVKSIGRFSALFPFSLAEIGLYALIAVLLARLLALPVAMRNGRAALWREVKRLASFLFRAIGVLFFLYTIGCGINYYRTPFSTEADLSPAPSSTEELLSLCRYLTEKVNESHAALSSLEDTSLKTLGREGQAAMSGLGDIFPQFSGSYPRPKPLLIPWILSVQQLSGVYSPFTIEANYNSEMPLMNIPHTICHELSHLKGYMREDEANFIAYLACIHSSCAYYTYSGYLIGWIYAGNALYKYDPESYFALYKELNEEIQADLEENNAFWDRFEGEIAKTSNEINDRYLKANSQTDGVLSYGRLVDLMLAWYRR